MTVETPDVLEVATVEVTLGDPEVNVTYDCEETVVVVVASVVSEVAVVYDFEGASVSEVFLGASEVTVLVLQPLSSQWVTVAVVYD